VNKRLAIAFAAYVALGVLAFTTLSDTRIRLATLAILAMFAVKTWVRRKDFMHSGDESGNP
jgi:heme/copper-type cytochrome/quinol oxidase subunit 4